MRERERDKGKRLGKGDVVLLSRCTNRIATLLLTVAEHDSSSNGIML